MFVGKVTKDSEWSLVWLAFSPVDYKRQAWAHFCQYTYMSDLIPVIIYESTYVLLKPKLNQYLFSVCVCVCVCVCV